MLADGTWLSRERVTAVSAISAVAGLVMLAVLMFGGRGTLDPFGQPVGTDFTAFWNAGRLANAGLAAAAYDPELINAGVRQAHGVDYEMAWVYPPTFLFIAAPLARLPYLPALLIWQLLSLAAIAAVLALVLDEKRSWLVALASPLTPLVLAGGQNAFLSAALLGLGLVMLDRRPAAGGAVFGALTYKPQLGLGIVPVLLFERRWLAIAAAIATTAMLVSLSAFLWGLPAWIAFPDGLANGRTWMEQGTSGFHKSASLFSMVRLWGGSIALGYAAQALGLILGLFLVWKASGGTPAIRNAAVCAAAALATPYLMDYDMATVGLGAAFLYAHGRQEGFRQWERSGLAFIWIAPWFTRATADWLAVPLGPPATLMLAAMVLARTWLRASPSRR